MTPLDLTTDSVYRFFVSKEWVLRVCMLFPPTVHRSPPHPAPPLLKCKDVGAHEAHWKWTRWKLGRYARQHDRQQWKPIVESLDFTTFRLCPKEILSNFQNFGRTPWQASLGPLWITGCGKVRGHCLQYFITSASSPALSSLLFVPTITVIVWPLRLSSIWYYMSSVLLRFGFPPRFKFFRAGCNDRAYQIIATQM